MGYVVVVRGLVSRDGVIARIFQVGAGEADAWDVRSARCSIQQGNRFAGPRIGDAVAHMLGLHNPLIITRTGSRVTICEVDVDMEDVLDHTDQVDVPVGRTQALHDAVLSGLDGELRAALTHWYRFG